jgi:hypothetical protein
MYQESPGLTDVSSTRERRMSRTLVFVYNADSGLFNALADLAHKAFSPETYSCNLCALTYSALGMRREWREFLEGLPVQKEFLHADELRRKFGLSDVPLPAIFERRGEELQVWVSAEQIDGCRTLEELQGLIERQLERSE